MYVVAGLDPIYGGPSYSVRRLAASFAPDDMKSTIYTVCEAATPNDPNVLAFPQVLKHVPVLSALRLSPRLSRATHINGQTADLIHSHGLWLMPNVYAGRAARLLGKPLVVSPRGMLAQTALAFSKWKKTVFWKVLQGPAYTGTALWHATSQEEAGDIRAYGLTAPIAIIPNGVDLPNVVAEHVRDKHRSLLFLSRLHPKKNLPVLIAAWARVAADFPQWSLKIVGPDEAGHRAQLEAQITCDRVPRVALHGAIYGPEKDRLLAAADLFVLPTLSENFGIAVAEALAAGVPAIVTKGAPWAGLQTERCGWWIDHGVEPLAAALRKAMALPSSERQAMGLRGRVWMERDFGWNAIASEMCDVYRWVLGRADRPGCVRLD